MAADELRPELIEDREIERLEDDRLDHAGIAKQLADLVVSIPAPSNVALYGAWGSGKNGIGNMLAKNLTAIKGIKFARFDAFKYAENPLRRNFVSVVAGALGQSKAKYHADLYSGRTNTDFTVPFRKLAELLGIFAAVVFVCTLIASVAICVVALTQGHNPVADLVEIGTSTLPASLAPASLLTAVIALVGKTFVVEKRVERAESDEEFEQLLVDLVNDSGAKRVVIFVDELDRCAPDDVVATLNAVRTFLGAKKCVFVVAADQQVLEQALSDSLTQATPADSVNPYYSAGSGYLDKVFQYQVSVPPLLPQSITSFAANLVAGRPGLLSKIDTQVVASILIPAHVRSPRRVKNLLNAFVLRYRLAVSREASGHLEVDIMANIDELARLVCLSVEFPLFARDLVMDPNLSQYILALVDAESRGTDPEDAWSKYPYVDGRIREIAEAYAGRSRAVDQVLVSDSVDAANDGATAEAKATQGQQLIDYLTRTRFVSGPTRALVHLQNTGSIFGLNSILAEQLEQAAQNAALPSLIKTFATLDETERESALDLLVQQARTSLGLEKPNVAMSILSVVSTDGMKLGSRSDAICSVIADAVAEHPEIITGETVVGAWRLGLSSSRSEGKSLARLVLSSDLAETEARIFDEILANGRNSVALDPERTSELVLAGLISEHAGDVVSQLLSVGEEEVRAVIANIAPGLTTLLRATIQEFADAKEEKAALAATTTPTTRRAATLTPASPEDEDPEQADVLDPSELLGHLKRLLLGLQKDAGSAQLLLASMLAVDDQDVRNLVEPLLESLKPITQPDAVSQVLASVRPRVMRLWPLWLRSIDARAAQALPGADSAFTNLIQSFKIRALPEEDSNLLPEEVRLAASQIASLLDGAPHELIEAVAKAALDIGQPATDESTLEPHQERVRIAMLLAEVGLSSLVALKVSEMNALSATLETALDEQPVESPLSEYVVSGLEFVLDARAAYDPVLPEEEQVQLFQALVSCTWLGEFDKARASTLAVAFQPAIARREGVGVPNSGVVLSYKVELSEGAYVQLLVFWLQATDATLHDILSVLSPELHEDVAVSLLSGVRAWQATLDAETRYQLVSSLVQGASNEVQSDALLSAIGLKDIPDSDAASILVDRYKNSTSNTERQRVLDLWRAAQLTNDISRRQLLREVLIPFIQLNTQAARIALAFISDLADPVPSSLRKPLAEAVVTATRDTDMESRARRTLASLGYKVESKGLFGMRKEIDTSS